MKCFSPLVIACLFFISTLLASIFLSQTLAHQETIILEKDTQENLALLEINIVNKVNVAVVGLKRMAQRWEQQKGTPKNQWLSDAKNHVSDYSGLSTVQWVDSSYHVRWIEPLAGNEKALGLNIAFNKVRQEALKDAADRNNITLTPPLDLVQGYRAIISYVPVYTANQFDGFIVGIFNVNNLFRDVLSQKQREQLTILVRDDDNIIYKTSNDLIVNKDFKSISIEVFNRQWSIYIEPKLIGAKSNSLSLSSLALVLGLLLSIILGFAVYTALVASQRSKMLSRKSADLRDANERYRSVVDNNEIGLMSINLQGYIESFNTKCETMFGYSAEEVIGTHSEKFLPDIHGKEGEDLLIEFSEGIRDVNNKRVELEGLRKDGSKFPIESTISEIEIDGEKKLSAILLDTTERIKEERILNEIYNITLSTDYSFENKLSKILESGREYFGLSMGIISRISGNDYEVQQISPSETMELGTHFEVSNTYCVHTFATQEVKAWHHAGLSEIASHPCYKGFGLETYIGTTIIVNEKPYGTVNFTDAAPRALPFTPREKAFINVIAQWLGAEIFRIQSLSEQEKLIDKLSDSNQELERFAYVCSHDMQEPLRVITSFSELLQKHLEPSLKNDDIGKKYFSFVIEGATRAQQLIKDILAYSKIDHDTQQREMINMNDLVSTIKDNMRVNLQECEGEISRDELPIVQGSQIQLYQLLQNLVNNGLKYRKPDVKPRVHISVNETGKYWEFSVRDNGIGMKKEHLTKIFEVFQRLHHRQEYAGTGIGLSICKKIVSRHDGKIWVESEEGSGSTIFFTLLKGNE